MSDDIFFLLPWNKLKPIPVNCPTLKSLQAENLITSST